MCILLVEAGNHRVNQLYFVASYTFDILPRKSGSIYVNERSRCKLFESFKWYIFLLFFFFIFFFFFFFTPIRWKLAAREVSYETTGPRCSICFHLELLLRLDIPVKSCLRQSCLLLFLPSFLSFFFSLHPPPVDCQQSASSGENCVSGRNVSYSGSNFFS